MKKPVPIISKLKNFREKMADGTENIYDDSKKWSDEKEYLEDLKIIRDSIKEPYGKPEPINAGGQKKILKVINKATGRPVAKASLKNPTPSSYELRSFLREARLTAVLDHPNIVPVYDVDFEEDGAPFFTMKCLTGYNLWELISHLKEDKENASIHTLHYFLEVFLKICDAIAFAHSKNIVHLDLKPDNIQVSDYGEVLVCDWGTARSISSAKPEDTVSLLLEDLQADNYIEGTPGYMAPEQQKQGFEPAEAADIYGLGSILFSILTMERPTSVNSTADPKAKAISSIICKARHEDPQQRYQSATELAADIKAHLSGFAASAEKASFIKLLNLLYKRNKLICNLLIAFGITVIFGTIAFTVTLKAEEMKAQHARKEAEQQRDLNLELSRKAAPKFFAASLSYFNSLDLDNAENSLIMALQLDENVNGGALLLGKIYLIKKEFAKAAEVLDTLSDAPHWNKMKEVAHKYKKVSSFKTEDYLKDLKALKSFLLISHILKREYAEMDWDQQLNLLRNAVVSTLGKAVTISSSDQAINVKGTQELPIGYFSGLEIKTLNLSGRILSQTQLFSQINVSNLNLGNSSFSNLEDLKGMRLSHLDISFSKVSSLKGINLFRANSINISGLKCNEYFRLKFCKSLKRIICDKDQINQKDTDLLRRSGIEIEVTD